MIDIKQSNFKYLDGNGIADRTIQVDDAIALMGDIHKHRGQLRGRELAK